ncbi:hypothetical protein CCP3SC1_70011 [Gammaproteobacteria bacterium]
MGGEVSDNVYCNRLPFFSVEKLGEGGLGLTPNYSIVLVRADGLWPGTQ